MLSNCKLAGKPIYLVIQTGIRFRTNSLQTDAKPGPEFETTVGLRGSAYSDDWYNNLLSCGRVDDQWSLARASPQDRRPQKCVIQAAALGPGTRPEPHTICIVAIQAPASGARTRHSSCVPTSMDKADLWTRVCLQI